MSDIFSARDDDEIRRLTAELEACQRVMEVSQRDRTALAQRLDELTAERDEHRQGREQDQALLRAEATLAAQRVALEKFVSCYPSRINPDFDESFEQARAALASSAGAALLQTAREVVELLRAHHESWEKGEDGDALDAPTRALLARPEVQRWAGR